MRARMRSLTAASLAAVACAATLAATPAAAAALPTPVTFGTSPAPLSGSASDPCGFTKPYGYIGNDDITFNAVISVPGGWQRRRGVPDHARRRVCASRLHHRAGQRWADGRAESAAH